MLVKKHLRIVVVGGNAANKLVKLQIYSCIREMVKEPIKQQEWIC